MAYRWTNTEMIQTYLDAVGEIRIGGNEEVSETSAELFENESVFEIQTILSAAWDGIEQLAISNVPDDLKRLAAKLTASRLGTVRVGGTLGQLPEWIRSFRHEVFEQVRFMVINYETVEITGATKRDVSIADILLKVKQRENIWRTDGS